MSVGTIITVVLAVLGALLGALGTVLGVAIRATLRNIELQIEHLAKSLGKDDSRLEKTVGELRIAIDEVQEEGRAADTHHGTIITDLVTQISVIRTIMEERFGRSSTARFPKVKQLSEPPAFLPPEARVVVRSTGVEGSGRYAAYIPPRIEKDPKR